MNQADEAWVQELYRYNARNINTVFPRRLADAEAAQDILVHALLANIANILLVMGPPIKVG